MLFYIYSAVINCLLSLVLGIFVFVKNPSKKINQIFLLFSLSLSLWSFSYVNWLTSSTQTEALTWTRLLTLFSTFIPVFLLHWSLLITQRQTKNKVLILGYVITLVIAPFSFTEYMVRLVEPTLFFPWWPKPGILYHFYIVVIFIFLFLYMFREYFSFYRNSSGLKLLQVKYVIAGLLIGVLGGFTNFFLWYGVKIPPIGNILVSAYSIAFAYSMVRYRFLDIRLAMRSFVVKIFLSLTFAIFLFIIFYLSIVYDFPTFSFSFFILMGIGIVFSFDYINKFVRNVTDSFLFQKEYSHQELLKNLGKTMSSSLNREEVFVKLQETLTEAMRVGYVGFVLWSEDHGDNIGLNEGDEREPVKEVVHTWGFDNLDLDVSFERDDLLITEMENDPRLVVFDELLRDISESHKEPHKENLEQLVERMRSLHAGVIMPLPASKGLSGIVLLGEKMGGDAFTSGDINTLETLMYQAGVAIENASLFTEVKEFNKKLRKEVARATEDLAQKNQSLTILRHLDQVIISSLGISEMAQKIVDTVSWELGYKGGFLILMDRERKNLKAAALSNTPHYQAVQKMLPIKLTDYSLPINSDPSNFVIKSVNERKILYTDDFRDLYVPAISADLAQDIQAKIQARHNLVYPLIAKNEVLGVLIFELSEPYTKLKRHEKELLEAFMDETGIAINNAMLYEELQRVNQELIDANNRLRELDQMKDELVSIASHELRTPMTAIKGYLWMALNKQKENLNESLVRYLTISYESSERLIDLVNDMLSVSRLEGKRIELDLKEVNVAQLAESIFLDMGPRAQEKGLKLFAKIPDDLPMAQADEVRLREIMINLVGNALKFTDKGDVWITAEALAPKQKGVDAAMIKIGVHDTGKGVSKEQQHKLFTKFGKLQQGRFVRSSEEGGTGLGLYISKGLVELHGGRIWVESDDDKGSTFYFTIPQAPVQEPIKTDEK